MIIEIRRSKDQMPKKYPAHIVCTYSNALEAKEQYTP